MKVYNGLSEFGRLPKAVVTIGTFDGVHIGHQKILKTIVAISKANQAESVVITFWPHPRVVLDTSKQELKLLSTIEEKTQLLNQIGIQHLIIVPFTSEFSQFSPDQFIRQVLLEKIGTYKLVIGYDHRFGKDREGSFEFLSANSAKYGFEIEEIPEQDIDNVAVSSTKIRHALQHGDIEVVTDYLGRYYSFSGIVSHGDKIGRTIGFPTANLYLEEVYKLVPADGIYACKVQLNSQHLRGMLYIGNRPVLAGKKRTIEVNIFDFNKDIYGEKLTVHLVKFIRPDMNFSGLDDLIIRMKVDEIESRKALNSF